MRQLATALFAICLVAGCRTTDEVAAGCQPAESPQLQEGTHLLGDQTPPVPYSSVPPTSGWHSSGAPIAAGTYLEQVSEPDQVQWLEQGGVVVAHTPTLSTEATAALRRVAEEVDGVVVTPYQAEMPTPITLTAWGVLQRCSEVTAATVAAFHDEHARDTNH